MSTRDFAHEKNRKAPEGTATGVAAGGVIGGTLGLPAGIGMFAIPGFGPFIAAGPIMASLAGLGVGGASEPWWEWGFRVERRGLVTRVQEVVKETGAEDIASTGENGSEHVFTATARW